MKLILFVHRLILHIHDKPYFIITSIVPAADPDNYEASSKAHVLNSSHMNYVSTYDDNGLLSTAGEIISVLDSGQMQNM